MGADGETCHQAEHSGELEFLEVVAICDHLGPFIGVELEQKNRPESAPVAFDLFFQVPGLHPVQCPWLAPANRRRILALTRVSYMAIPLVVCLFVCLKPAVGGLCNPRRKGTTRTGASKFLKLHE